jgi:hypothetical protein
MQSSVSNPTKLSGLTSRSSADNGKDDVARLALRFDVPGRLDHVLHWVATVDHGSQLARFLHSAGPGGSVHHFCRPAFFTRVWEKVARVPYGETRSYKEIAMAIGLFFVVLGVLQASEYSWFAARQAFYIGTRVLIPKGGISPLWLYGAIGALFLLWFFLHLRSTERAGKEPLLPTRMFRNRTSNLGLTTQLVQWLTMQGSFFVISVFLQTIYHFSAIQTGLTLVPATIGILLTSALAGRLARWRSQKVLVVAGFTTTIAGILLLLARSTANVLGFIPGLLLVGAGVGVILTMSVNVVQSAFP